MLLAMATLVNFTCAVENSTQKQVSVLKNVSTMSSFSSLKFGEYLLPLPFVAFNFKYLLFFMFKIFV
jgi:hypothetical protein